MKELLLKATLTKKLKKNEILSICKLKNTHWKHGINSHLIWFNEHVQKNDIHNLAYLKEKLVGYALLRNRNFLIKKKKGKYLYYDTLIVAKKQRKQKIGHKLANLIEKVIKKSKLHSMLVCEKKNELFHKRYKWKKKNNKKSQIIDHKYPKNFSMMCLNQTVTIAKNNIKYFIFN
jgi:predicted N-acetyltransferase YhbS